MISTLALLAVLPAVALSAQSGAPLFGWATEARTFQNTDVSLDQHTTSADFIGGHMSRSADAKVAVFLQDSLTFAEVAASSDSLPSIKNAMESSESSIFVPSVQSPETIATLLSNNVVSVTAAEAKKVDLSGADVVVINLGATTVTSTDDAIATILSEMSFSPSVVLVSGREGSEVIKSRVSRSIYEDTATNQKNNSISMQRYCNDRAGISGCHVSRSANNGAPKILFGSTLVLMGLPTVLLMIVVFTAGVFGLMVLENPDRFPDVSDAHLIISTRNE